MKPKKPPLTKQDLKNKLAEIEDVKKREKYKKLLADLGVGL